MASKEDLLQAEYHWIADAFHASKSSVEAKAFLAGVCVRALRDFGPAGMLRALGMALPALAEKRGAHGLKTTSDLSRVEEMRAIIERSMEREHWREGARLFAAEHPVNAARMWPLVFQSAVENQAWSLAVSALAGMTAQQTAVLERATLLISAAGSPAESSREIPLFWRAAWKTGAVFGPTAWAKVAIELCARCGPEERGSGALEKARALWLAAWEWKAPNPEAAANEATAALDFKETGLPASNALWRQEASGVAFIAQLRANLANEATPDRLGVLGLEEASGWMEEAALRAKASAESAPDNTAARDANSKKRDPMRI